MADPVNPDETRVLDFSMEVRAARLEYEAAFAACVAAETRYQALWDEWVQLVQKTVLPTPVGAAAGTPQRDVKEQLALVSHTTPPASSSGGGDGADLSTNLKILYYLWANPGSRLREIAEYAKATDRKSMSRVSAQMSHYKRRNLLVNNDGFWELTQAGLDYLDEKMMGSNEEEAGEDE